MPSARHSRWVLRAGCALGLLLAAACSGATGDGSGDVTVATTGAGPQVPETVPLLETVFDLAVTSDGSNIAYKAAETYAATVAFYQTGLAEAGWEKINKNDAALGGSTTLLRARPEATISVTIQGVPGDDNAVRVLISYINK